MPDLGLDDLHPHVGVGGGHRRGSGRGDPQRGGLEGGEPHGPGDAAERAGGQLRLGGLDAVEQLARVARQDAPRLGQAHAAARTLEQDGARLALQRGELLGDGARRVVERPRGGVDRPARLQLAQDPQPPEVEHRQATLHGVVQE